MYFPSISLLLFQYFNNLRQLFSRNTSHCGCFQSCTTINAITKLTLNTCEQETIRGTVTANSKEVLRSNYKVFLSEVKMSMSV